MAGYGFDQRTGVMYGSGGYQPPRPSSPYAPPQAPRPQQPQPPPVQTQQGMSGSTSSYSYSRPPAQMNTTPMTFQTTALNRPQRQAVNDPGMFGQQAGAVNSRLAQLLDPAYQTVNENDADVNPLVQSIDRSSQQAARLMQATAAERAAAEGTLQGGGFSSTAQQINEQAREQAGDQKAQLMWDKSRERQGQIQQALAIGGNLLDSQQTRNLQRELADLQNEQEWNKTQLQRDLGFGDLNLRSALGFGDLDVRNRGLDIQSELGRGDLDLRRELGLGGLDLQRLGITNQNNQFYDRLGFDRSAFEAQMNAAITNNLLGF